LSLAKAREKRDEAKALLANGVDPMAKAKAEKEDHAAKNEHAFALIATELAEKLRKEGKADTTLQKKQWLIDMAKRDFGNVPIREVSPATILETLKQVEALGNYETGKRLRSTIGQVLRYAVATARADNDPTYALRGALIAPKVSHMAAATSQEGFAAIVGAVWAYESGASNPCRAEADGLAVYAARRTSFSALGGI
jgi:integrase